MKKCLLILMILSWFSGNSQTKFSNSVIINEIFADPTPAIGLPEIEFVELYNTGSQTIYLRDWLYSDAVTTYKFTSDSIAAGEYLIICPKTNIADFEIYGRVLGISPWPSLNNSGDLLTLKNNSGEIINQVNYSSEWYLEADKKAGGYSLELIDPFAKCSGSLNWKASIANPGGSPGKQNSIYQANTQETEFKLIDVFLNDSSSLIITYNRFPDSLSAINPANYSLNNGIGIPASINFIDQRKLKLRFTNAFSRGLNYSLTVQNVSDCAGTLIDANFTHSEFFIPKVISKSNILINEILFNPRPEGVDFVEIYNNSESLLDLQELYLANISKDTIANKKQISNTQLLINPHQYLVLTIDPENIKKEYLTESDAFFVKMASLPAFNDDKGTVVLLSKNNVIDRFDYSEKMHFQLIKDAEGISLERSSFSRESNEPGNFRSATASARFATPGYKNSQAINEIAFEDEFKLSSKTFSPDNDGFEDELEIAYHFSSPGFVANISIYNEKGILVKKLLNNFTLASEGIINWNGFDENSKISPVGIYLIYADFFDAEGKSKRFRKTCVLAQKLN